MLNYGLRRAIQADREREIHERLRRRGLLREAIEAAVTDGQQDVATEPKTVGSIGIRAAFVRAFGAPLRSRIL